MLSNLIILSDLLHHLVHHFHIKLHHFMIQYTTLPFFLILQNTSKYKGLRSYINLWKSIVRKSINSCLYCSTLLCPPYCKPFRRLYRSCIWSKYTITYFSFQPTNRRLHYISDLSFLSGIWFLMLYSCLCDRKESRMWVSELCPLVLRKRGDANEHIRSAYTFISCFCGSVLHR